MFDLYQNPRSGEITATHATVVVLGIFVGATGSISYLVVDQSPGSNYGINPRLLPAATVMLYIAAE